MEYGFDRPIELGELFLPPRIEIDGDQLVWSGFDGPLKTSRVVPEILEGFTSLSDAPDKQICAYARRFGVLKICEHSVPMSHQQGLPSVVRQTGPT
jgi:hypothetical protein